MDVPSRSARVGRLAARSAPRRACARTIPRTSAPSETKRTRESPEEKRGNARAGAARRGSINSDGNSSFVKNSEGALIVVVARQIKLTLFSQFGSISVHRPVEIRRPRAAAPILSRVDRRVCFIDVLIGVPGVRRRALVHHGEGLGPDRGRGGGQT